MSKLKYIFTPAIETRMRLAWSLRGRERTTAIDTIVRDTKISRNSVKKRAIVLGLCTDRRRIWTAEQDSELRMLLGDRSTRAIARHFDRSVISIKARAFALDMRSKISEGYTHIALMRILGAPWHRVDYWIEQGWLIRCADTGRVTDESVTAFVRKHIDEIDFRLADQNYLKGVFRHAGKKYGSTKGIPCAPAEGATRRGKETRLRSRSAERTFQLPLPEYGGDAGAAEMPAFMGQKDASLALAEEGICEIR